MILTSDRVEGVISFHLSYCARFHDLVVSCDAARCESAKSGRFWAMPMIEIEDCARARKRPRLRLGSLHLHPTGQP